MLRHVAAWSGPDLLDLPLKVVVFFLLTTQLSKAEFGFVSLGMMVFSYNELLQFGVTNALMLRLPQKYVEGDSEGIVAQTSTSMTFTLFSHVSILCIGLIVLSSVSIDSILLLSFWCYAAQAVIYQYYLHQLIYLRYTYKFAIASKVKLAAILTKFLFDVISLFLFGVTGYLLAQVFSFLVPILLLHLLEGRLLIFRLVLVEVRDLLAKGFPFFLLSVLAITSGNIDRWFVAASFSIEQFASYAVLMYVVTVLLVFPNKLLSLLSQYLREVFVLDENEKNSFSYVLNILLLYSYALPIVAFVSHFILALVIRQFIPQYEHVVPFLGITLLLFIFRSGLGVLVNYLYLMEYRSILIKSQLISLILSVPVYWTLVAVYGPELPVILLAFNMIILFQVIYILSKVRSILGIALSKFSEMASLAVCSISGFVFLSLAGNNVLILSTLSLALSLAFAFLLIYQFQHGKFVYVKNLAFRKHESN